MIFYQNCSTIQTNHNPHFSVVIVISCVYICICSKIMYTGRDAGWVSKDGFFNACKSGGESDYLTWDNKMGG